MLSGNVLQSIMSFVNVPPGKSDKMELVEAGVEEILDEDGFCVKVGNADTAINAEARVSDNVVGGFELAGMDGAADDCDTGGGAGTGTGAGAATPASMTPPLHAIPAATFCAIDPAPLHSTN